MTKKELLEAIEDMPMDAEIQLPNACECDYDIKGLFYDSVTNAIHFDYRLC